jgi:hypothetical protein
MSDFFTHLTEQTLGIAPVVEPVIAPMYAPGPSADGAFLETVQLVEPAQSRPYEKSEPSPQPPGLVGTAEMTPVEKPTSVSQIALPPVLPSDARVPENYPPINKVKLEAAPETGIAPPLLPVSEKPALRDAPDAPDAPEVPWQVMPAMQPEQIEPQPLLVPVLYQPRRSEAIPEEAGQIESQDLLRSDSLPGLVSATRDQLATDEVSVRREYSGFVRANREPLLPRLQAAPLTPGAEELSEPSIQPVIRVTIGRVEVRLSQTVLPAPSQPAPSHAPELSLEEYLRQRNGGKR